MNHSGRDVSGSQQAGGIPGSDIEKQRAGFPVSEAQINLDHRKKRGQGDARDKIKIKNPDEQNQRQRRRAFIDHEREKDLSGWVTGFFPGIGKTLGRDPWPSLPGELGKHPFYRTSAVTLSPAARFCQKSFFPASFLFSR